MVMSHFLRASLFLLSCSSSAGPWPAAALSSTLSLARTGGEHSRYLDTTDVALPDALSPSVFEAVPSAGGWDALAGASAVGVGGAAQLLPAEAAPALVEEPRTQLELQLQRTAHVADYLARDAQLLGEELHSLEASLHGGGRRIAAGGGAVAPAVALGQLQGVLSSGQRLAAAAGRASQAAAPAGSWSQLDERWLAEQERFAAELREPSGLGAGAVRPLLPETTALLSLDQAESHLQRQPAAEAGDGAAPAAAEGGAAADGDAGADGAQPPADDGAAGGEQPAAEEATADSGAEEAATPELTASNSTEGTLNLAKGNASATDLDVEHNAFMNVFTWGYRFDTTWSIVHWSVIFFVLLLSCYCCCHCMSRSRSPRQANQTRAGRSSPPGSR